MQIIKLASRNALIDFKANQLTFLDGRFYRSETGVVFPSVTTYLEAYPKTAQFYEWLKKQGEQADEIRDAAGDRGSNVHKLTEDYDNGLEVSLVDENGYIAYKMAEWAMFERYVEFRTRYDMSIVHNELNLVCDKVRAGGTIDRVIEINGRTLVVDIKTSNSLHKQYWLQLAAYKNMLTHKGIFTDGIAILWLNAKTRTDGKAGAIQGRGWKMCIETDAIAIDKYFKQFRCVQELWWAENEDVKPRETTYRLTYQQPNL